MTVSMTIYVWHQWKHCISSNILGWNSCHTGVEIYSKIIFLCLKIILLNVSGQQLVDLILLRGKYYIICKWWKHIQWWYDKSGKTYGKSWAGYCHKLFNIMSWEDCVWQFPQCMRWNMVHMVICCYVWESRYWCFSSLNKK